MDVNDILKQVKSLTDNNKSESEKKTLTSLDFTPNNNDIIGTARQAAQEAYSIDADIAKKYNKYGLQWTPKDYFSGSLDVQLADVQSNWAKFGNALAQTIVSEIGLGTALGISDLFDAIGQATGMSDHDYNNPLSAKLEEWQEKFNNEVAPIYSRPGSGFDNGTDFGWWMQNIPSIASSLTLLLPAAGVTKGLSLIGKGIAKGTRAGAKWARNAARLERVKAAGHTLPVSSRAIETGKLIAKNASNAALMRTMENYQESRQVYNDMYSEAAQSLNNMTDEEYNNFLSRNQNTIGDIDTSDRDEVAKAVARNSADQTFKIDYVNAVFDFIELCALRNVAFNGFRNSKVSAAARRLDINSRRFAGKYNTIAELEELASKQSFGRKAADKIGDILYSGRTVFAAQASEGVEEAINYIAQQEGMHVGHTMLGMEANNNVFSNRLNEYMQAPELWESAFWGVVGGIVFQGAGSGLNRVSTAIKRKNELKKNKPNEQTGEDVNANTSWKALWELPDVKRVKVGIENRLAIEQNYIKTVKDINENNALSKEEKDILLRNAIDQKRTQLVLNAIDSGTINMLRGYLEDENVKQAMIDKGIITKEQADAIQTEDIAAIDKIQQQYDDNVRRLNAASRSINAKNGTVIPVEYLQIIARNNIGYQLSIENYEKQLEEWTNEAAQLYNDLDENDKIDKNIDYKNLIRLQWLTQKLGELEADKRDILKTKEVANSVSGQERLRELNNGINNIREMVSKFNPENSLRNLMFAITNSFAYERQKDGTYKAVGTSKEYLEARQATVDKNAKYFEELDKRLVGIAESNFGEMSVLDQDISRALGSKYASSIKNISQELGTAYAALAELQYTIADLRSNIKITDEDIELEVKHLHNYMNEVRKQKIQDATETLKGLANTYGSDAIRELVRQRYNGESLDFSGISITDADKELLTDALDTLHLDDKLNSDIAEAVDVVLAMHKAEKAAHDAAIHPEDRESSSTSENQNTAQQNGNMNNPSPTQQESTSGQETGQNQANDQQNQPQPTTTQNSVSSGLRVNNIGDERHITYQGDYVFHATDNPDQFEVEFAPSSKNTSHFNNNNLFAQEDGVSLMDDNYIIGRNPIIYRNGNVVEKGTLVLKTNNNIEKANINQQEESQKQQAESSTGVVTQTPISPEQLAGPIEQSSGKLAEDVAEVPYEENDITDKVTTAVINIIKEAHNNNSEVNWNAFREELREQFQPENSNSKIIDEIIERGISWGKQLAERKGIKSVDAVLDVVTRSSKLRENTPEDSERRKQFSEAVNKLLDVFNEEIGLDSINGRKYINVEALCRYCDKILKDKVAAKLLADNIVSLVKDDENIISTDTNIDEVKDKLEGRVEEISINQDYLGIQYDAHLKKIQRSKNIDDINKFYEIIDNLQPGDKVEIQRGEYAIDFYVNGIQIGQLPYPKIGRDGSMYQYNDGWRTDILISNGEITSMLENLFVRWATDLSNSDIKELNDIIVEYAYRQDDSNLNNLLKRFENNKEVIKAKQDGYIRDVESTEKILNGIAKIWRFTRSNGSNVDNDITTKRKIDIHQWFVERVAPSFTFIEELKNNSNLEVEVNAISEGETIITTRAEALPASKAIGSNYKQTVRLGIVQSTGIITLAGNGINGNNTVEWRGNPGNTFVVIPSRNGNHAYIHAFPQKVTSTSISKSAKEIKSAIYAEITRICNNPDISNNEKSVALEQLLRQLLPSFVGYNTPSDATSCFFARNSEENTIIDIRDNPGFNGGKNGCSISFRRPNDRTNTIVNIEKDGSIKLKNKGADGKYHVTKTFSMNEFANEITSIIDDCCTFNLSFNAINSDAGQVQRQSLTKRGSNGEFIVSIPNQQDFTFASYNDFVLQNDLVLATTKPTKDGKSNFERIGKNEETTQQITVRLKSTSTTPITGMQSKPEDLTIAAAPQTNAVLDILKNTRIKNKSERLADLLFGKKIQKRLSFNKNVYRLFPKNIIFVDTYLDANALANTSDRPYIDKDNPGLIIPSHTVVLGKEWIEMATSSNEADRKEAVKKLIHEQLHILLHQNGNERFIEQIREIFDEFASRNTDESLNDYLYKWDEERYYIDGKINEEGLEEFLVETLTNNKLANALNNIQTISTDNTKQKKTLLQKIMEVLAKVLGIDIKKGSLYEKEFKLLRDIFTLVGQNETVNEDSVIEQQKSSKIEQTEETFDDEDDMFGDIDMSDIYGDRRSVIRENITNNYTPEMQDIKAKAIADGIFMKTPNGKPTNLNERQWLQVRTKAFKEWFGDWINDLDNASKVVDENGEPLVVYHGSTVNFNEFITEHKDEFTGELDEISAFFSTDKDYAAQYANPQLRSRGGTPIIYEVFLNVKNPDIRWEHPDPIWGEAALFRVDWKYAGNHDGIFGHDLVITNEMDIDRIIFNKPIKTELTPSKGFEIIVFNPNQIKSATGNIGIFSREDNDIRRSRLRENKTYPSISAFVDSFPIQEQSKVISQIENGEINITCK